MDLEMTMIEKYIKKIALVSSLALVITLPSCGSKPKANYYYDAEGNAYAYGSVPVHITEPVKPDLSPSLFEEEPNENSSEKLEKYQTC